MERCAVPGLGRADAERIELTWGGWWTALCYHHANINNTERILCGTLGRRRTGGPEGPEGPEGPRRRAGSEARGTGQRSLRLPSYAEESNRVPLATTGGGSQQQASGQGSGQGSPAPVRAGSQCEWPS